MLVLTGLFLAACAPPPPSAVPEPTRDAAPAPPAGVGYDAIASGSSAKGNAKRAHHGADAPASEHDEQGRQGEPSNAAALSPPGNGAELKASGPKAGTLPPAAGSNGPVPVTPADPQWGNEDALVSIVAFSDLECPFCGRVETTLAALQQRYGPAKLRVVWKHMPLSFHKKARTAAEVGTAVHMLRGNRAFRDYVDATFRDLRNGTSFATIVSNLNIPPRRVQQVIDGGLPARKVDADIELAGRLGVRGTPAFLVNGEFLSGAQPQEKFEEVIDRQLAIAKALLASGVAPNRVYVEASKQSFNKPKPAPKPLPSPSHDTTTVWKVPIDGSPVLGPATAGVTIVIFSDFQCPFCARALPTLERVRADYGNDVRLVFKHQPLPFHKRARPAAFLSIEAFKRQGHAGFWKAHDKLFANNQALEDPELENYARELGLHPGRTMRAIQSEKYKDTVAADQALASDLKVRGTPNFFINGRRLVGAQPFEKFASLIDEELVKVKALRANGIPGTRLYDELQKDAKEPPPPETKTVTPPTADNPAKGPARAKVTIQIFSDFQCPFCSRVTSTLDELEKDYRGRVRFVFRHKPLPFHRDAKPAAIASHEVFKQRGAPAFWKYHDLLFENQKQLDVENLVALAAQVGANGTRVRAAIENATHEAIVQRDIDASDAAGIGGTPAFLVNNYFVSGAQPYAKFKKLIDRALREAK